MIQLFDAGKEGVHIDVHDGAHFKTRTGARATGATRVLPVCDAEPPASRTIQMVRVGLSLSSIPASTETMVVCACCPSALSANWIPTPLLPPR